MSADQPPRPPARRGRPPAGEQAMTPAERQRAYRRRQRYAQLDSMGSEAKASRVTLLGSLGHALAKLEMDRSAIEQEVARVAVRRIIEEIVTRYGIEFPAKYSAGPDAKGQPGRRT